MLQMQVIHRCRQVWIGVGLLLVCLMDLFSFYLRVVWFEVLNLVSIFITWKLISAFLPVTVSLLPVEAPILIRMFSPQIPSLARSINAHIFIGWGRATSRGFIVYVTSELLCIGELSMASDAFTLDTLFLLHRGANFINCNSNSFAIKFAHRLYVAPFFAWVVLGRFHVLTRGAAMKWWLALEACLKGGGKHSTMWMYQNCLEIAQRRSK